MKRLRNDNKFSLKEFAYCLAVGFFPEFFPHFFRKMGALVYGAVAGKA